MYSFVATIIISTSFFATPHIAQVDPGTAVDTYNSASDRLDQIRQQRQERVDSVQEVRRERIASKSAALSERKQQILNNLVERFSNIKTKWVSHWGNVLTRLETILAKIEARAIEEGIELDISEATASIAAAQLELEELVETEYLFDINDDASVGEDVRNTLSIIKSDMQETREAVFAAKKSVQDVFAELRELHGDDHTHDDE